MKIWASAVVRAALYECFSAEQGTRGDPGGFGAQVNRMATVTRMTGKDAP